jgi:transcriptional regulator with GAF, ATPase, and Fis domain
LANSPKSGIKKAMIDEPTVTVNQAYLKAIEKRVEDLRTLIEVSAIISSTLDFSDLMTLVMEKTKGVMGAEACSILLYDKENNKLKFDLALSKEGHPGHGPRRCRLGGRASNPTIDKGCKYRQPILSRG